MNYLAHIYLSGDNELVTIGNFMADSIKGKSYKKYTKPLQVGILLHRHIDTFTDSHPIVKQSTKRLHKKYSHYSGVIVDIFYDHFLAKNWKDYSQIPLGNYVDCFYKSLNDNYSILPKEIQYMMPYLIADNWLLSYSTIEGIGNILKGMNKRTKNRSGMNEAVIELKTYYHEFEVEFTTFFEELIKTSKEKLKTLNQTIVHI